MGKTSTNFTHKPTFSEAAYTLNYDQLMSEKIKHNTKNRYDSKRFKTRRYRQLRS